MSWFPKLQIPNSKFQVFIVVCFYFLFSAFPIYATDYTSTNFILRDPVITVGGGRSTSTNFEYFSSLGQTVTGESATGTSSFTLRSGFLYFPVATSPVVTATAGDTAVSFSWTAATSTLGSPVATYELGRATTSGGPYTFTNVGSGLTATSSGLTNGTAYFFVVRALDSLSAVIVTSVEASSTPVASGQPPPSPGGGGSSGGGGGYVPPTPSPAPPPVVAKVNFLGRAYPKSTVTLLKDAQIIATIFAGIDADFKLELSGLSAGNYIFSLYTEDKDGRRSSLLTFPVSVTAGATTTVSGIFIAPTIAVDKSEVKRGDDIAIFGQAAPQADIVISVNSEEEFFARTISDKNGIYLHHFDTILLDKGTHNAKSKASIGNQLVSSWSPLVGFKVGAKSVVSQPFKKCPAKADLNSDCKVNLVDFSIAAYWYKRPLSMAFKEVEKTKLNGDGKVNLTDFSIMAFHWTG